MGFCVCHGATLQCILGKEPSMLMVTPENRVFSTMPLANIMDNMPLKNIMPFGMCNSMANPMVAAATAANMGILTPIPCMPEIIAPWVSNCPRVMIANQPALNDRSLLMCKWGGIISVVNAGQFEIMIS